MVGIAGGVPHPEKVDDHVRLGDVVVSMPAGVVQYDFSREANGHGAARLSPRPPHARLLEAVAAPEGGGARGGAAVGGARATGGGAEGAAAVPLRRRRALASTGASRAGEAHPGDPGGWRGRRGSSRGDRASGTCC